MEFGKGMDWFTRMGAGEGWMAHIDVKGGDACSEVEEVGRVHF